MYIKMACFGMFLSFLEFGQSTWRSDGSQHLPNLLYNNNILLVYLKLICLTIQKINTFLHPYISNTPNLLIIRAIANRSTSLFIFFVTLFLLPFFGRNSVRVILINSRLLVVTSEPTLNDRINQLMDEIMPKIK